IWEGSPASVSHQWLLCNSSGASCANIAGATGTTYTLASTDVGGRIKVAETATNAGGNSAPSFSSVTSIITTPVGVVPPPVNSSPPAISGFPQQGQTLTETHGSWNGNPGSYAYQWERCSGGSCQAIPGATDQSYTLTAYDVGQTIVVAETASNS